LVNLGNLFVRDDDGRTVLFEAAEQGRQEEAERIIFSLAGTGFAPQRLALIVIEDNDGLTAADVAERSGHRAIADLLRGEQARMEFFE
jgi:ankyrin repeat protein